MSIADRIRVVAAEEHCTILDDGTILFCDALGRASLAIAIEDEFGIPDLPEDEIEHCGSVDDWVSLVGRMNG